MATKYFIYFVLLSSILSGCNFAAPTVSLTAIPTTAPTLEFSEPTLIQPISTTLPSLITTSTPLSAQQSVLDQASEVITLLKNKDMLSLSKYIHPLLGLRFSPYAFVKDTNQVFSANEVAGLLTDSTIYTWGNYDGSGAPIELPFAEYYSQFVYDVDFADAPQIALNHRLGVSTSMDNNLEFYPGGMIVEYYFPGFDPQYAGMDWRSLRLVFMQDNNNWYLAGIIHDQWTI
ncbi:MAG: hypothetical protein WAV05_05135 [Anaerolineales bacterium]